MGWFFEEVTLQQKIAELTQDWDSTGPDSVEYKDICLAHAYFAETENFGVLWCVRERRSNESSERRIVCNIIESCNGLLGHKELLETDGPSYGSVPLSFLSMVPLEVHRGDEEWREAVLYYSKEGR